MRDESWYRRRTWSSDDQAAFFARLKRSRSGFHKAQYCRIQAYELEQAGLCKEALGLLDFAAAEWPDNRSLATEYSQRATCLEKLGEKSAALAEYRHVFDAQRKLPSILTAAHLDFALLVALTPFPECYGEALSVLSEFPSHFPFPFEVFKEAAARAIIARARGECAEARRQAGIALEAAAKHHSGFRYHAKLGLVGEEHSDLIDRLREIV